MQLAGSSSWRLSTSGSQLLEHALFVRDAVGLQPPPSRQLPPPLANGVPDCRAVVSDAGRADAGRQWLWWWRRLVTFEFTPRQPADVGEDPGTRARRRLYERGRAFDPPDFRTLEPWTALQSAVVATLDSEREWERTVDGQRTKDDHFDWALTRDVAEEVIAERGVSPDRVDGSVIVLNVAGSWHHLAQPGAALCSAAIRNDPITARALLRDVFISGLRE